MCCVVPLPSTYAASVLASSLSTIPLKATLPVTHLMQWATAGTVMYGNGEVMRRTRGQGTGLTLVPMALWVPWGEPPCLACFSPDKWEPKSHLPYLTGFCNNKEKMFSIQMQ